MIDFAVVLAVSSPTHHSQLTYNRARTMLPALGKPLVVRAMERLYRSGIERFVVVVGANEGALAAYLNAQWMPNVSIEFVLQPNRDNLAKTLSEIATQHPQPFLITNYNAFTHNHFAERLLKVALDSPDALILSGANSTLSTAPGHHFAVHNEKVVTSILTQSTPTDQSLSLIDMAVCGQQAVNFLAKLPDKRSGLVFQELLDILHAYVQANGETYVVESAWTLQVETDFDLLTLNKRLLDEEQDAHILSEVPSSVHIIPPVRIDPQVSIGQGATIGPYAYLEKGCSIGHQATVQNAVVMQKAVVPAGETVSDMILATRARIRA